jgi:hypothetical protein
MGRKRRPRFSLEVRDIGRNEAHPEMLKVQQYLERFGYLGPEYQRRVLDEATQKALERFQRRVGLDVTGVLDPPTAARLEEPRCGFPDTRPGFALLEHPFPAGCKYDGTRLRYAIVRFSEQATIGEEIAGPAIRAAFDEWQKLISLDFVEVSTAGGPELTIGWDPIDIPGNVIADAFPPPPCGDPTAGQCSFDEEDKWDVEIHDNFFALKPVAVHEIGHLLGLAHVDLQSGGVIVLSVMNTFFNKSLDFIPANDPAIPFIQQLYGTRT